MNDYKPTHQQRHQRSEGQDRTGSRRSTQPQHQEHSTNSTRSPHYTRGPRRSRDDDDKGTVLTCKKCLNGFFSHWEAPEGFDPENPVVPKQHQTCENCITDRIFKKNMAILDKSN
ncbi:MAG: hypothetical protein ACXABY_17890 [Candidatus Thorarchaeota archaeon]